MRALAASLLMGAVWTPLSAASDDGSFYFRRGEERFRRMEYDKALREYQRAIRLEPDNEVFFQAVTRLCGRFNRKEEAWRQMAAFYRRRRRYEKALSFYRKILAVRGSDLEALNAAGSICGWKKEYKEALVYYGRSLKIKKNAGAFQGRGDVFFFQGLLDSAEAEYKKALALEPAHRLSRRRLGQLYERREEYEKALPEYEWIVRGKGNDAGAWSELGWANEVLGRLPAAFRCYVEAVRFQPDRSDALQGMGRVCVALGRAVEAEQYFLKALRASRGAERAGPWNGLGWMWAWRGDDREAVRCFYRALRADPSNVEARTGLGWVYGQEREYRKAEEWYRNAGVLSGVAWVRAQEGKYGEAAALYEEILRKSPTDAEAYNGLGWMYLKTGDFRSAGRCYGRSLRLVRRNADAHYGLGRVAEGSARFEEALEHYKKAVGYNALNPSYRKALGMCYLKQRDYKAALEALEGMAGSKLGDEEMWNTVAFLNRKLGREDEAKEIYRRVLSKINPASAESVSGLGEMDAEEGNLDSAVGRFKEALRLDPNSRTARRGLAAAYRMKGMSGDAVVQYRALISSKRNDVESWNDLGWLYFHAGDDDKALECYREGFSFLPDNPDGLVGVSAVWLSRMRRARSPEEKRSFFRNGVRSCLKVLDKAPDYREAYLRLSELYLEKGAPGRAESVLEGGLKALERSAKKRSRDRRTVESEIDLRRALFLLKRSRSTVDLDRLVRLYRELLEFKMNDGKVWLALASLYKATGLRTPAREVLKEALGYVRGGDLWEVQLQLAETEGAFRALLKSDIPNKERVYFRLGKLLEQQGDLSGAIHCYERAVADRRARLSLARALSKKGWVGKALRVYASGLNGGPMDQEYEAALYRETGEIYLRMRRLRKAEEFYRKCLSVRPDDFDSQAALADIARFKGDYPAAAERYGVLLERDPSNPYLRRMLGNIRFWTGDWDGAAQEYGRVLQGPISRDREEARKDLEKLKEAEAVRIAPRVRYSESKEDDAGKGSYVIRTRAWDGGLRYRKTFGSRYAVNGGFSYASVEEKNLRVSQDNFGLDADDEAVGLEYRRSGSLEMSGTYHHLGYRKGAGDTSAQRTPLRGDKDFHGYEAGMEYHPGGGALRLKASKEPIQVKIFSADPEVTLISKYGFSAGLSRSLWDFLELKALYGWNLYSPAQTAKQIFQADAVWRLFNHELAFFGGRGDLPLTGFQRPDGLRVLGVSTAGFSYVNRWFKNLVLSSGFKKRFYSDQNRGDLWEASAVFSIPSWKGFDLGYKFGFEDYRFTSGTVGGEPIYRSPEDLAVHAFSVQYDGHLSERLALPLGYIFSVSSEGRRGHSAFIRPSFRFGKGASLNLEMEINDDAGFAKERKILLYFVKLFS